MSFLIILFWLSLATLFFCYIGYGVLLFIINAIRSSSRHSQKNNVISEPLPVTLIVSAYNEEAILRSKIENSLSVEYPSGLLKIIFVTDGSVDDSPRIVEQYPSITLLHESERKGKSAAINRAMRMVQTPLVIFSDANSTLNKECIARMVAHYRNPKIGGVAGEKKILQHDHPSAVGQAEGLYWKYESFMKDQDARFNTVVGAAGELFSIRTALFKPLPDQAILDDFIISMQVCLQGYKIAYEPGAFATELPSASLVDEEKRKVRISAGAYQSIALLKSCLKVFKHPLLSFQYISRRLLRWVFCPVMLIALLVSNALIVFKGNVPEFYSWSLFAQAAFYFLAFFGWLLARSGQRTGILTIPFYFTFMNYCLVRGFFRFLNGRQSVLWEKSLRQTVVNSQ
jgi:poly-beta-1,6-N-acetyl-D-glucosamine synthase